jgi:RNA polymerase sigma factor (sigma-70 family)
VAVTADGGAATDDDDLVAGLRALASEGLGVILGLAPEGRRRLRRVARPGPAFEARFVACFESQRTGLVRYAVAKFGVPESEDLVQQAFEAVWASMSRSPRDIDDLAKYVQTSVRNEVHKAYAARVRRSTSVMEDEPAVGGPEGLTVNRVALQVALGRLSPREREAVVLRHQWGLGAKEAAELMAISEGALARYVHDGLRSLRRFLDGP